jgi:hypothetical protein
MDPMEQKKLSTIWRLAAHALGGKNDPVTFDWDGDHESSRTAFARKNEKCDVCGHDTDTYCHQTMWARDHKHFWNAGYRYRELLGLFCVPCCKLFNLHASDIVDDMCETLKWEQIMGGNFDGLKRATQDALIFTLLPQLLEIIFEYARPIFNFSSVEVAILKESGLSFFALGSTTVPATNNQKKRR